MERWQRTLKGSLVSPEDLASRFRIDINPLKVVARRYPMRVSPPYFRLIQEVGDPIWRQCVPEPAELVDGDDSLDPLREDALSPVPAVIHRYPDRVVLLVSFSCATYCRFCMRKRWIGQGTKEGDTGRLDQGLEYIAKTESLRDVILSGGDPLMLPDEVLEAILSRLRAISHIEIIRINTRMPVTLPERITRGLCRMLRRHAPLYVITHFNHPIEINPASAEACGRLADAGIPLGNQTVLLRGVNDDPEVMRQLVQRLLAVRVRPYYLHQMDPVRGTAHFRTSLERGLQIMAALRGHTSGLANPYFVVDLPGGKGKVPILPDYVKTRGEIWQLLSYRGEVVEYPNVRKD